MAISNAEKQKWAHFALSYFWSQRKLNWKSIGDDYKVWIDSLNYDVTNKKYLRLDEWYYPFGEMVHDLVKHPQGGEASVRGAMQALSLKSPSVIVGGKLTRKNFTSAISDEIKRQGVINTVIKASATVAKENVDTLEKVSAYLKYVPYILVLGGGLFIYSKFRSPTISLKGLKS